MKENIDKKPFETLMVDAHKSLLAVAEKDINLADYDLIERISVYLETHAPDLEALLVERNRLISRISDVDELLCGDFRRRE